MEQDTNQTYDSCKNCEKLEEEACRLELAWAAEIRMNNKLKKEIEQLTSPSPTGDRDCEELKKEVERLKGLIKQQFLNSFLSVAVDFDDEYIKQMANEIYDEYKQKHNL